MDLPFSPLFLVVPVFLFILLALGRGKKGTVTYPYVAAPGLFTEAESRFLRALEQAAPEYRMFGKVRVADVIGVQKGLSNSARTSALNRITSKHIDFVLCRPHDLSVVCAVELDDKTHERKDRRARDVFLENALAAADVPLVRVKTAKSYDVAELQSLLRGLEVPKAA